LLRECVTMSEVRASIGQVKRDISDLVNRVAYRGDRVVLTSRGKPKAVLVSVEEYDRLKGLESSGKDARWTAWLAESEKLGEEILARRDGKPLDIAELLLEVRADLEARDAEHLRG
jgi:prevent-host-death family protein